MINLLKTGLLFAILTALLMGIGYIFGGSSAVLPFFLIALVINLIGYYTSDKLALRMAHARELPIHQAPEIHEEVKRLSNSIGIPMPKIYTSDDPQPNAFATGRNPEHSVICLTRGLLETLSPEETKGVLAHELGHIKNRDILVATLAAVIAGAIASIAQIGFFFGSSEDDDGFAGNILLLILAPISASLIQLAISRSREYGADHIGATTTGKPLALASALVKIHNKAQQLPLHNTNPALSSLYIQNPFKGHGVIEWFSTHPATEKRVEKLEKIANELKSKHSLSYA